MSLILIKQIRTEPENFLSDEELNEAVNEFYEERDAQEAIDADLYPLKSIRKSIQ